MCKFYSPLLFMCLFCLSACLFSKKQSSDTSHSTTPQFKQITPYALRGELDKVFDILNAMDQEELSAEEAKLKHRYHNRFTHQTEVYDYKTEDTLVINLVDRFHDYWQSVMLNKKILEEADADFRHHTALYLYQSVFKAKQISLDSLQKNFYHLSNDLLRERGFYANAFGKTAHLYDLFLWKKQDSLVYPIALIDDSVNVSVYLMKDFISTGWSHYATFGKSYAGGWATREALFCVAKAYDIESENFLNSYLPHEGQHFSDYRTFPKLQQRDLEYRAKLVELVKSKNLTHSLIQKFIGNAAKQQNNAHAFANYCVIRDLSKAIFEQTYVTDKATWMACSADAIRQKSRQLFEQHTDGLMALGKEEVRELIK